MSERTENFVDYIIHKVENNKGDGAALRRADNPSTEYQAWEILAGFGINLEKEYERLPFVTIAAAIARVKPVANGKTNIGQVIARCYEDGNQSDQAKAKLRRILACETPPEVCLILRQTLRLIESKDQAPIDYASLLNDLLWFSHDESRQKIKARWAQNFFAHGYINHQEANNG